MVQKIFKRTEKKYIITGSQFEAIIDVISSHASLDTNGQERIFSLYFDTHDDLLIRRSIDKPLYKEKLRLRAYGVLNDETQVFIEIKKKFKKVVYKRRVVLRYEDAKSFLASGIVPDGYDDQQQILNEILWFLKVYDGLSPSMLISYDRGAYYGIDEPDLRITFDSDIRWKTCRSYPTDMGGTPLLSENKIVMEVKTSGSFPLWLAELLSKNKIYPVSFSKAGAAHKQKLLKGGSINV